MIVKRMLTGESIFAYEIVLIQGGFIGRDFNNNWCYVIF